MLSIPWWHQLIGWGQTPPELNFPNLIQKIKCIGGAGERVWQKKKFFKTGEQCHNGLDNGHQGHNDTIKYPIIRSYTNTEIQSIQHCISLTSHRNIETWAPGLGQHS